MRLNTQSPKKALKAFLKQRPSESERDKFKNNLIALLDKISVIEKQPKDESEEHLKNNLRDFLRDTFYIDSHAINTKDKKDLVIHIGKRTDTDVAVIIEAKRPSNKNEMVSADNANKKALHELILYYLTERNAKENVQLKQMVVTDINQWFIIDANYFDKHIYRNTQIRKLYETKVNDKKDNPWFYEEIAKIVSKIDVEIPCVFFDIRDYEKILRNTATDDDKELVALYKILSPQHLLKIASPNDSNTLNERFYKELLYIIGLEEAREGNKNVIRRKLENKNAASLIELTIEALKTEDTFHRIPDIKVYGDDKEEQTFNIALELCITWINRILFLKLLEGQLIAYHQGSRDYRFLNSATIHDYDELFKLFHKVLAVNIPDRTEAIKVKYSRVPYLNSSLFEISELEDQTIKINSLENDGQLELINSTILKEIKKNAAKLPSLDYLFQFLDAYDFASEGSEDWQKDNKQLINASVLGKVFEKINGYRDGSIFTPAFITMYMCRQSIRLAIVEKFNEALADKGNKLFDKFDDVKNYTSRHYKTEDVLKANEIIDSLHICDPAVGSGHFLVSALNEIIAIKAELGILADENGSTLSAYEVEVINDELDIRDRENNKVEYKLNNGKPISKEVQRLQKTLFHQKQTIIENCLFGVDINPKSVLICRLRLWIELLKNAYYKEEGYTELETLPNIDINIKCGNSLLSRFSLDADLSKALKNIKYDIKAYRGFVSDYKNEKNRDTKRGLQIIIDGIKSDFKINLNFRDKEAKDFIKAKTNLVKVSSEINRLKQWNEKIPKKLIEDLHNANKRLEKMTNQKDEIENNKIYKNAFEWRFEFPEVLSNDGEFEGFDMIIANPPYIQHRELAHLSNHLKSQYVVYSGTADISSYFFEKFTKIVKPKGVISVINSNKFFNAEYGKTLRKFLSNYMFYSIVNFEQVPIFDEALVSSAIFTIVNQKPSESFSYVKYFKEKVSTLQDSSEIDNRKISIAQSELKNDNWLFNDSSSNVIVDKIKSKGLPISEIDSLDIKRGITTGFDDAYVLKDNAKSDLIKAQPEINSIVKPLLRGKDITKYAIKPSGLNLLFIPWHFPIQDDKNISGSSKEAENEFKKLYPFLFSYLEQFKDKLSGRNKDETGIRYEWYALQRCANTYYDDFEKEKIVWGLITGNWGFSFDDKGHFLTSASFFITSKVISLKFILALFNSNLYKYYFIKVGEYTAGGAFVLKKTTIEKFIIPSIELKLQQPFIQLVDQIIEAKQQAKETTDLEKKIDELVYKLYDITEEEQKLIEST